VRLSAVVVRRSPAENQFPGVTKPPGQSSKINQASTPPINTTSTVRMAIYDQNFDELDENAKAEAIIMLLETSPSIKEMATYLKQQRHVAEPSLRTWVDRLSPATLGLMRWIIASNRSCIVQVDECPGQEDSDAHMIRTRLDERVINMDGWVQFRFAQGAPDKEHRFHTALEETQHRRNSRYPTIFAWHGSRLENWHSIIRTGLDFKETLNGRACGHGCYHSLDYTTSAGYSTMYHMVCACNNEL
jgi:ubiquitin-conjugating enzyme E2 Q